jgi:hypothetical protein
MCLRSLVERVSQKREREREERALLVSRTPAALKGEYVLVP